MTRPSLDEFPLLNREIDGKRLLYLDSAATSLKPSRVLQAEADYARHFSANVHRGRHALSEEASAAYDGARRRVASFIGAQPSDVVFVRNTTEALNVVAAGLRLTKDARVLALACDHHSTLLPWMRAASLELLPASPLSPLDPSDLARTLDRVRPQVFAFAHASNVTGLVQPAAELCRVARDRGVLTVVDAAQSAPHLPLDVAALGCDFLAFSAHKMLGPTGIGVLWGHHNALERLEPLLLGGGVVSRVTASGYTLKPLPERLEAGTPHISGALGLAAAVDFLQAWGMEQVAQHGFELAAALRESLADLPNVRLLAASQRRSLPIATLVPTSDRITADHLAMVLSDSHQIMLRSGSHCAHLCFDMLNVSVASLRASAYLYTQIGELGRLNEALRALLSRLA